jgi:hypothetical protein
MSSLLKRPGDAGTLTLGNAGGYAVGDESMTIVHEYTFEEMPKRKLLKLFKQGAKLFKICENSSCDRFQQYQPIESDQELMTYCMRCGRKVLRYGVEQKD